MSYHNQLSDQINFIPQALSPLSITTIAYSQNFSQKSSQWSPFSAPSFSPYDCPQIYFQYSSYLSPGSKPHARKNLPRPIGSGRVGYTEEQRSYWHSHTEKANIYQQIKPEMGSALPKRSDQIDMSDIIRQATLQRAMGGRIKSCTFCKTNGEPELIYTSHSLKDVSDKITCPVLMQYACPDCGATGEKTHTKKYCPVLQKRLRNEMLNKFTFERKQTF
jgi:hypothetical protein